MFRILLLALLLAGCAGTPDPRARPVDAGALAAAAGLLPFTLGAGGALPLHGQARLQDDGGALVVYIEGDGRAWRDRRTPSTDPTPRDPVALRLAARDPGGNVVWLARPGQYLRGTVDARYWRDARFAPEVIDAYVAAVRQLAAAVDASAIDLAGFSGGGAVAALVAARLKETSPGLPLTLRTVAGNLDTQAWTTRQKLSPLAGSLNPADAAATLRTIPQLHLTGTRDTQVPPAMFAAYVARLGATGCVHELRVDATHAGPWEDAWRAASVALPVCTP